ncbi:conserved hypothetical protein [Delftia phage PhiW-14]|uniref:Uncharacterized protein n=1 Tax=Delftia phage PhiW-14 TaxID=665032 RepID=C9DG99_BPW14|nr:hypothetical protein DP-phiW-14_gp129 [Delftia phage PhiW-14]ACV50150.1 conserved hypothetical protein [Delftia phage PhiW-14]
MNRSVQDILWSMQNSSMRNYAGIPGLSSHLLGAGEGNNGTVRMFSNARNHPEFLIPHSHRYDFACLVLKGSVTNILYVPLSVGTAESDAWSIMKQKYKGSAGEYDMEDTGKWAYYNTVEQRHGEGEWYTMTKDQIHSIKFSKGAQVLFFQGPNMSDETIVLQPRIGSVTVPTFHVAPWMFKRDGEPTQD